MYTTNSTEDRVCWAANGMLFLASRHLCREVFVSDVIMSP
ncbi:hypothetical protein HMPREF0322_01371 [Desulfitobacterium hafniense DP7]|uniref:Uncharacterized protein n=1 Tax=Desulfitobacterium hafniense DP7 TaxID=537010 RepID=G9XK88_DESHA|nr:hypothetical protein HMPREF0322_01371 [Desulfitobacterium hafniense DP7]